MIASLAFVACGYDLPQEAPRERSSPPGLVFERALVEMGRLPPEAVRDVRVPWRRVGAGVLRILAIESDCGCAIVSGPKGPLAAGARGAVDVRVRGPRRLGVAIHRVRVFTDRPPPDDILTLRLRVRSESDARVLPHRIDVGRRSPGARLRRDAEVRLAPELGSRANELTIRLAGIDGDVRFLPPLQGTTPARLVRLELRAPSTPGDFTGRLLVLDEGVLLASARIDGWVDDDP